MANRCRNTDKILNKNYRLTAPDYFLAKLRLVSVQFSSCRVISD